VPSDELTIQVGEILGAKKRRLSKDVLNLRGNLTELDIFDYWKYASMFTDDILRGLVKSGKYFRTTYRIMSYLRRTNGDSWSPSSHGRSSRRRECPSIKTE
jgi:hypothetical protein